MTFSSSSTITSRPSTAVDGSFARLLAHGQRKSVGALRHSRVEANAMLADLDTLDGEFLAAVTVRFVFHKPGGGSAPLRETPRPAR